MTATEARGAGSARPLVAIVTGAAMGIGRAVATVPRVMGAEIVAGGGALARCYAYPPLDIEGAS